MDDSWKDIRVRTSAVKYAVFREAKQNADSKHKYLANVAFETNYSIDGARDFA